MPFTYVVNVYSDMLLSKGHLGSVHCWLVVTCWERANLLAIVGDVHCICCYVPLLYPGSGVVLDCIVFLIFAGYLTLVILTSIC